LKTSAFFSILGIVLLTCITITVAQAVEPLWIVNTSPGLELKTVSISADGSLIVAGGDQLVGITREGKKLWAGWDGELVEINRDGKYILTSQGPFIRLFDSAGASLWDQRFPDTVTDISITPDGLMIAAGSGTDVKSWYNSGAGLGSNTTSRIKHLRISPTKDQIVVTTGNALRSFNVSYVPFWTDDEVSPDLIEMSADGTHLVTASGNWIWYHHGSGNRIWEKHIQGGSILSLAFSRDGSIIVAGQDDNTITVLDSDGNILWTAQTGNWVTSVRVSDNGSVIVAGSMDKNLYVFDRKGTPLGTFQASGVFKSRSVGISGDGSRIVAADGINVYGFSRSQFSRPPPTATSVATIIPAVIPPDKTLTRVTTETLMITSPSVTVQTVVPPIPATTQKSGVPWILSLVPIAVIAFIRQKRRT
jgi:WD40 repeat protein